MFSFLIASFGPPRQTAHKFVFLALFVGVLMKIPFIALGAYLAGDDAVVIHVGLGLAFLAGGVAVFRERHEEVIEDIEERWAVRAVRRLGPVTDDYEGSRLTVSRDGQRAFTPAAVLLAGLTADLFFGFLTPMAFAFEKPPFLVLASGSLAIVGIRSLYYLAVAVEIDRATMKISMAIVLWIVAFDLLTFWTVNQPTWMLAIVMALVLLFPFVHASWRGRATASRATPAP